MRTNPAICRFLCTAALLFGFSFLPARAAGQLQEVWEYDSAGNVLQTIDPLAGIFDSMTYDTLGNSLSVTTTDPLGNCTNWQYDPAGNVLSMTDVTPNASLSTYDNDNNRLYEYDSLDNRIWSYDPAGNALGTIDPLGIVESMTYDTLGNTLSVTTTDALGNCTNWQYDPAGNVLSMTDVTADATLSTYDNDNNRLYEYDSLDNRIWSYDPAGNVLGTIDPLGNVQSMTYDTLGNVLLVGEVNAAGQNSLTAYDSAGNILSSFNVPGQILSTAYDADGNAVWIAVNVPEPTTASAIAVALLTAWRRPRRAPGRESAI
ncbi:MAG: hypothetical protein ABSD28_13485 [Tepidisphaeraceae bacterium]|jgi:YD repeat-containing protein